jgi:D-inositol-3-phosphate glycosyltransferase
VSSISSGLQHGLKSVAVLAYHSSPLAEPGSGDSGGMTVYVRRLAEAFTRLGVSTDIYTRSGTASRSIATLSPRARIISIPAGPAASLAKAELEDHVQEFAEGVRSFALGQRIDYDIVHSHYWQSGLAAKSLAAWWSVPLVHSHHTLGRVKNIYLAPGDVPEPPNRLRGEEEVNEAADVLIASTDDEWEHLSCLYGVSHDRIKTIHPGVDHTLFHPGDQMVARRSLGLGDELVLLYAGRIQPLKGLELAIRTVEKLQRAVDRPLLLLVVGGASGARGSEEVARLEGLASSLGVADQVRFAGPQSHERLAGYYQAADALVVCSHSESFGLSALEAQACGTPVVGTAVGGLSYVVEDGVSGFLVDTRDPDVFSSRLERLLCDGDLRGKFRARAERSASAFSWAGSAGSFLQLYDCLLEESLPQLCTC